MTTTAWLHLVAAEGDGDYHIQISNDAKSQAKCIVVEVPKDDATLVQSDAVRTHAKDVRQFVREVHGHV